MPTLIKKISTPRSIHEGSIGSVGAKNNDQGALVDGDFTFASGSYFELDGTVTNSASLGGNLTENGTIASGGVGFFGRENLYQFDGVDDYLSSADAHFNPGDTDFSYGTWVKTDDNTLAQIFISNFPSASGWAIKIDPTNGGRLSYFPGSGAPLNIAFIPENGRWYHTAATYTASSNDWAFYLDGQKVGTTNNANSSFATFRLGSYTTSPSSQFLKGSLQGVFYTRETLSDADINAIYSKRYQNAQLAGGHQLDSDSSPFTDNTDKMFMWPLDADTGGGLTDVSGNGKTLSNLSSNVVFTGVDPFGNEKAGVFTNADNDSVLENADPALDIAAGTDFSMGGFFAATDWATSGSHQAMIGNNVSGATGGVLGLRGSSESRLQLRVSNSTPSAVMPIDFTPGSWHHIAAVYVAAENKVRFYTDGYFVGDRTPENAPNASAGGFCIGGRSPTDTAPAPHDEFGGRASQCFFAQKALTDEDIRKLASARIDFTSNTTNPTDMQFEADYEREDSQIKGKIADGWMVDKRDGKLYVDFGSDTPGDKVNIKLREDK